MGNILTSTDTNNINPYRYAGYRYDSVTGLYYLIARYYDPTIGKFLNTDPVSITPDYTYGSDNPVFYVDPNGNFPIPALALAGAGAGAGAAVGEGVLAALGPVGLVLGVVGLIGYAIYEYATSDDGGTIGAPSDTPTGVTLTPPYAGGGGGSSPSPDGNKKNSEPKNRKSNKDSYKKVIDLLKRANPIKGEEDHIIETMIDEFTKIQFRKDFGENAHPIKPKGYTSPTDHYNVKVFTKNRRGRWGSKLNLHIITDVGKKVINFFID